KRFNRFAINANQNLIAINRSPGRIRVGNWQSGDEWETDAGPETVVRLTFSKDGEFLDVNHGEVGELIDVPTHTIAKRSERGARLALFNADGSHYNLIVNDQLHIWNTKSRRIERSIPSGHFSVDERLLVRTPEDDCSVIIYDVATLAELARIQPALPPGRNH